MRHVELLIVVLIALLIVVLPGWPYSRRRGFGPAGAVVALIIVVLTLIITRGGSVG